MRDRATQAPRLPSLRRAVALAALLCCCGPVAAATPTPAADAGDAFSGARGLPIVGPAGRCLTADGSAPGAAAADCDGRAAQDWKFVGNSLRLGTGEACLTADADGAANLAPCTQARNQFWAYTVKDAAATSAWKNADLYGQIRPLDEPTRCLALAVDPFKDAKRALIPARVVDCLSVAPRQMSWFLPIQVHTLRVALVRYGEGAAAGQSDDALKASFAALVARLDAQFHRLGLRFVFDPAHDFRHIATVAAADAKGGQGAADALARLAAGEFYRRIPFVVADQPIAGDNGAPYVDYDPAAMADPVSGQKVDLARWSADPDRVLDKAGLPALAAFIAQRGEASLAPGGEARVARAFADYLGLGRSYAPDKFADADDDAPPPCLDPAGAGCPLVAFSPMQLARMSWTLRAQLNRLPLVSCQPTGPYDADALACEDAESLALCRQTAAYLAGETGAPAPACAAGGAIRKAAARAMKFTAVEYVLKSTPSGQALIKALAGLGKSADPAADKTFGEVVAALGAGKNIPLAQALLNRVAELRELATRDHSPLAANAFAENAKPLTADQTAALARYAPKALTPDFIAHVPAVAP